MSQQVISKKKHPQRTDVYIFLSCPKDVTAEKHEAERVIEELNEQTFINKIYRLNARLYENEVPPVIGKSAQPTVDDYMGKPADCYLTICIFANRMGTPFTDPTTGRRYQSGTEYEFINAFEGKQRNGTPHILVYRKITKEDADFQKEKVDQFFSARIEGNNADFPGLYASFDTIEEFRKILKKHIEQILFEHPPIQPVKPQFRMINVPPLDEQSIVSRPTELKQLREIIISEKNKPVTITAMRGMGGIGKTHLANMLCFEPIIRETFKDGVIWLEIGQIDDRENQIRKLKILNELANLLDTETEASDIAQATAQLEVLLKDKNYLIILDNVWQTSNILPFTNLNTPSRFLVTTRNGDIALAIGATDFHLDVLTPEQSQQLLAVASNQNADNWDQDTQSAIAEITELCGYLPVKLNLIGSRVDEISGDWHHELQKLKNYPLDDQFNSIMADTLSLLPERIKNCYLDLTIFPRNEPIQGKSLEKLWATRQLGEIETLNMLTLLKNFSLLNKQKNATWLPHDLQREYIDKQFDDNSHIHDRFLNAYLQNPTSGWHTIEDDGYIFDHLIYHLEQSHRYPEIHALFNDEDWAKKRSLPKLLQDFDYAKMLVDEKDIALNIQYAIFDEMLKKRYPSIPIEITSELVVRGLVSSELIGSSIEGMQGDAEKKVQTYISVIEQVEAGAIKEKLALDALGITQNISVNSAQDKASLMLDIFEYLSESNRRKNFRLLWQSIIEIESWKQRKTLLTQILPSLDDGQLTEMKDDLLSSNIPLWQVIFIYEEIKDYLDPIAINELGSFILDKIISARKYDKIDLLDYFIKLLPDALQRNAQKYILPAYMECTIWDPNNHATGEKSSFETLVKWIPIEDLPVLWERALRDVADNDGGVNWRGKLVQWAIIKHWITLNHIGHQQELLNKQIHDFIDMTDPSTLGYQQISWCGVQAQLVRTRPKDKQLNRWQEIYEIACKASWPDGSDFQQIGFKKVWLDEFVFQTPEEFVPSIWQSTLNLFEEVVLKWKAEKSHWDSSARPRNYVQALVSLAQRIPADKLDHHIKSTISLWINYHDYRNNGFAYAPDWAEAIARLLDRLDETYLETQWDYVVKIALSDVGKKPYVHSGQDFLFHIAGSSRNIEWQDKKIIWLLEIIRTQTEPEYQSHQLLYNFHDIPEKYKTLIWLEATQKLDAVNYNDDIFRSFETVYPQILDEFPDITDRINWDFSLWEGMIKSRHSGGYKGFTQILGLAPDKFRLEVYQLIKNQGEFLTPYEYIYVIEFISRDEQQKIIAKLADIWSDETVKELASIIGSNWKSQTIWGFWEYICNYKADHDIWSVALAPHIPEEYITQAYEMSFKHIQWSLWAKACVVLTTRLPQDFADTQWDRLTEILKNDRHAYNIKDIRSSLASSLSEEKLLSILTKHRNTTQSEYKKLTEYDLIGGSLSDYFGSLFLLSSIASKRSELFDLELEDSQRFWNFVINFHKKHKIIPEYGALIYSRYLAFTFPIMLPIIRVLRPIDSVLCLSYIFYIASNLDKLSWQGFYSFDSDYFETHKTLLMRFYERINPYKMLLRGKFNQNRLSVFFYTNLGRVLFLEILIFRFLRLVGLLISIVIFPLVLFFRAILLIIVVDLYRVDERFKQILNIHLRLSNKSVVQEDLDKWISQGKSPDILVYRPLLNKIGGKSLRKSVAEAHENAHTWWYKSITRVKLSKRK